MSVAAITVLLLFVGSLTAEKQAAFQDYQVFSIDVASQQQLDALRQFEALVEDGINFWKSPSFIGGRCDIMVAPNQMKMFVEFTQKNGLQSRVMVENVQQLIDSQKNNARVSGLDWTSYHSLETIYEWLDEQLLAYPTILTGLEVGKSYEKRTIRAVRMSHKAGNPLIFIESNIHAREWITSATATWFLNQLLTSTQPEVQDLAQNFDWVIIPVFNVDGFEYSHTTNRMWRKTRYPHGRLCYGADANRNFDHMWMSVGSSSNICDETFAGSHPLSEVESQALVNFVSSFQGQIKMYLAFHSYSQLLLFPWAHTAEPDTRYNVLSAVALKAKEAYADRSGTVYTAGSWSTALYYSSGISVDWVYATQNVSLAYTIEFRDLGRYGFLLPADQIIPNGEETLDGLIAMIKEARVQNVL